MFHLLWCGVVCGEASDYRNGVQHICPITARMYIGGIVNVSCGLVPRDGQGYTTVTRRLLGAGWVDHIIGG